VYLVYHDIVNYISKLHFIILQELLDKKLENEVTFRTWKERKDEMLREKLRKARAEEK